VGRGGVNSRSDVELVQSLINSKIKEISPLAPLAVDGIVGPKTIGAIERYQKSVVGLSRPDGRVDPGGKTITALLSGAPHAPGGPKTPGAGPGAPPGKPSAPKSNVGSLQLRVERFQSSDKSMIGKLFLNDKYICYTLEEAWRNNAKGNSCVPAGTYNAYIRYTSTKKNREWCFELTDVPNRTAIQFHIGNDPGDTEGCILLGTTYSADYVGNSTAAYQLLQDAVFGPGFTRQQIRDAKPAHGKITAEFRNPA
jgi:peptidoglycan hydrolase-like protein with peptidoglycan-binding domain